MFAGDVVCTAEAATNKEPAADPFAHRQFDDKTYLGTQIRFDKLEFEKKINEIYRTRSKELVDGCAISPA